MKKIPNVEKLDPEMVVINPGDSLTMDMLAPGRLILVPWGEHGDILFIRRHIDTESIEVISEAMKLMRKITLTMLKEEKTFTIVSLPEGKTWSKEGSFNVLPPDAYVVLSNGALVKRAGSRRWLSPFSGDFTALPIFPTGVVMPAETVTIPMQVPIPAGPLGTDFLDVEDDGPVEPEEEEADDDD
jgi:hypothetical protein